MDYIYEDRLVAFIDILGFKNMVEQSVVSESVLTKIHKAMQIILNEKRFEEHFSDVGLSKTHHATVSTFSDSIVISYLIGPYSGLLNILLDIIHLQLELAYIGILIRGGITIGKLYHDGQIVFGPAMNEAYSLESSLASSPRIVINQEVLDKGIQLTHDKYHSEKEEAEFVSRLVRKDNDGVWYLDFLSQFGELDYPEADYYSILLRMRGVIICALEEFPKDNSIHEKYEWLKGYFNNVIDTLEYVPDASDWYDGNAAALYKKLRI